MRIHINGANHTVTGSQFLLEVNGQRLLLECGLFQGKRLDTYAANLSFRFQPGTVDAAILSHAHIDHSGNLPNLVRQGYRGKIFTTRATAKLADVMLRDSGHIQEADAEFISKKRLRRGEPPLRPLYTSEDAAQVANHFEPVDYEQAFQPIKGVTAHLVDAGHILGSAAVVLDIVEGERKYRLWYSGDIGRKNLPLLRDPVLPSQADYLMMECTYGDTLRPNPEDAYTALCEVVKRTIRRGGKVIIPAFAVGRTQEIVYDLNRMFTNGDLPRVPVFVDSPLAVEATKVFQQFPELFDEETRAFVLAGKHPALNFDGLKYTQSVEESKALNTRSDPMVIISASGMAETGRILHHLRNNIENPRNTILIVSWQAPDTLGRRLVDGERTVRIFGEAFERRAEVAVVEGFSAHASQEGLLEYAQASRSTLKQIFLVHGEPDAADAFRQKLVQFRAAPAVYPDGKQPIDI